MTPEQKARMRDSVRTYMAMKPVGQTVSVRTAYAWMFSMRPVAAMLVVVVFLSTGGISYAAERALPGDTLYTVKTNINEPVKGALAVTASAKAQWAVNVATTRLEEAATLAAEGRLDTDTQTSLKENFDEHANTALAIITQQATTSPDTGASAAVSFEAKLSEYERVLTQVGDLKGVATGELATAVREKHNSALAVRAQAEASARVAATTTSDKLAASRMRETAINQLKTSLGLVEGSRASLDDDSAKQIVDELARATDAVQVGINEGSSTKARDTFAKVLSATEKVGVFLKTSSAIHARTGLKIADANKNKNNAIPAAASRGAKTLNAPAPAPAMQTMSFSASATLASSSATTSTTTEGHIEVRGTVHAEAEAADQSGSDDNDSHTLRLSVPTTVFH